MLKYFIKLAIFAAVLLFIIYWFIPEMQQTAPDAYKKLEYLVVPHAPQKEEKGPTNVASTKTVEPKSFRESTKEAIDGGISGISKTVEEIGAAIKNIPSPEIVISNIIEVVATELAPSSTPPPPEKEREKYVLERKGYTYRWGVTVTNTPAYNDINEVIGYLKGGTVVEVISSQLFPGGYFSKCKYVKNEEWQDLKVNVYDKDIVFFKDSLYDSNDESRRLLVNYCTLYGQREELIDKMYNDALKRNPYLPAYKRIQNELSDFKKQDDELIEARQNAEGAKRVSLEDELRKRKTKRAQLIQQRDDLQKQYEKWVNDNLGTGANKKTPKTPEIEAIEIKMASMREDVWKIVPGL